MFEDPGSPFSPISGFCQEVLEAGDIQCRSSDQSESICDEETDTDTFSGENVTFRHYSEVMSMTLTRFQMKGMPLS